MSIPITGLFKPYNDGYFPIYEDVDGYGGFQVRNNITDRNLIPDLNRKIGMLVYVVDNNTYYKLAGGITNSDWVIATFSSNGFDSIEFSGFGLIQDGVVEVSEFVSNARFTVNYPIPPDSAILTDDDGTSPKDVTGLNLFNSDGYFQKNSVGDTVTFTLTVTFGVNVVVKTFTLTWSQRIYYGIGIPGENTNSFILSLSSILSKDVNGLFTVKSEVGQKIYIAHSSVFGTPVINFNGFEGAFTLVSNSISVTNSLGFTDNYTLWESDNDNLGLVTLETYP